ncbi:MAG: 6-phosphofructokinase [Sedimentisphaerales bacterium]|nr:6-phosphofructokinase [Sedimentisphaerales bacterium]
MSTKLKGNAVVGQSGGPTAVINQSLVGVIEEACQHDCIDNMLGALHGVEGIRDEKFVDLKKVPKDKLEIVANSPSSALGSSRVKPDKELCNKIFDIFQKNNIRYFFYIGGNDSASSAHIVNNLANEAGYELRVFHVPKTIDNDLLVTDHCPGYGSAARFVIQALMGDDLDNRALPGIKIDIIMGRHAGFLTAATMMARSNEDDGPHLIYVPETKLPMEQFIRDVKNVYSRLGRCVVVASEGIVDENGTPWAKRIQENVEADSHGNIQLSGSGALADALAGNLKESMGVSRIRADTFGYLQRSFAGVVSDVDAREARLCGQMAVRFAVKENIDGSVSMRRLGDGADYKIETFVTELDNVAVKTKSLPAEYISDAGNNINESYRKYLAPLVGKIPQVAYLC